MRDRDIMELEGQRGRLRQGTSGLLMWTFDNLYGRDSSGGGLSTMRKGEFAAHRLGRCLAGMLCPRNSWYPQYLEPETLTAEEGVREKADIIVHQSSPPSRLPPTARRPRPRPHVLNCGLYFKVRHVQAYEMTLKFRKGAAKAARRPLQSPASPCYCRGVLHGPGRETEKEGVGPVWLTHPGASLSLQEQVTTEG
ncbi:hypothetical protein E2C01_055129 [Portunus trituberculatus]|uniref:Uncharacterized protein n=1 Tax=Portunus trituberculatus TaxID=210409 RepID=A0A5B7GTZ5_PORTR|nr:hypothetical protein [Portunus trituberculatus]